ncbi:hypothetical protein GH5_05845 [Leishmania sp. Ghana 2012 LV757]|uniref:hypothetical protein n=1 Tax=Leishmania sp. Ghana 2012 LV757 TaxID=2803181 RepID=UPI001B6ABFC8|nr:hypothetical protein GH5_05845 [Leishmania sp. Ghana 2012 LV757]
MRRYRGIHCKQLLAQLPRNLLIFDGHCLLCQARVRYVLERNYSFFSFLSYITSKVEIESAKGLDLHRIHFASFDSKEGDNMRRFFFQRAPPSFAAHASSSATLSQSPFTRPEDLVLLLIEKVPSQSASFLSGARPGGFAADDRELFRNATTAAICSGGSTPCTPTMSSFSSTASARLVNAAETDLFISTNYTAMCRVGMHLDRFLIRLLFRFLIRLLFRFLYCAVPTSVGDWWFERYVCRRRKLIWGTSEQDAVKESGLIEGLRERRWTMRGVGSSSLR